MFLFKPTEARFHRVLRKIASLWETAYAAKNYVEVKRLDARYHAVLCIRERMLGILPSTLGVEG